MKISREEFLNLKQSLAAGLAAGDVSRDEAVAKLVEAGWHAALAVDFVSVIVDGKGE